MKVKLLKKVRKRYKIYRCDELPNELGIEGFQLNKYRSEFGLPFYYVQDESTFTMYPYLYGSDNINSCKSYILELVKEKYEDRIKNTKFKSTKIWG